MRLCISSTGGDLSSQVDPRFGRCAYFIFYDTDDDKFEAVQNTNAMGASGVGIQSAQLVINKGAQVVITGNVGPNAFGVFSSARINIISGVAGIAVKEAIERFKKGEFKNITTDPTVPGHFGIGGAFGNAPSGRGGGRGRGMFAASGGFMPGGGFVPGSQFTSQPQLNKEQELQFLKQQVEVLKQQLEVINKRIQELES